MAFWNRNKENPIKVEAQNKEREVILNDAKFMEWVEKNPNLDSDSGLEKLKPAHESFKATKETARTLKDSLKNEISKDLGFNLKPEDAEELGTKISEYLERELVDNPERITELKAQVTKFAEFQKQIKVQEQAMEKLGVSLEDLRGKSEAIKQIDSSNSWGKVIAGVGTLDFSYKVMHEAALNSAKEDWNINLQNLNAERDTIGVKLAKGESIEAAITGLKAKYEEARKAILDDMAPIVSMYDMVRERAQEKGKELYDMNSTDKKSLKDLGKAKQFFDRMSKAQESNSNYDIDVNYMDKLMDQLNKDMEEAAKTEMQAAVEKVSGSSLTLRKAQEVLKPFLGTEQLGDKSRSETKQFIRDYLKDELMPKLSKSQQMLLAVALESY